MKRVFLLSITNFAVMIVLSIVTHLLGLDRYLTANGLNIAALLVLSAIFGFGGAFISLFISKWMAIRSTGAHVIESPTNDTERWLVDTVHRLADKAGIGHPEVAIYEGAANAFATGASRNNSLVAVSTGLLESMDKQEVEAVLGHEIAHITNGDMVTLTLIQGVVNTFVFFLARLIASVIQRDNRGGGAYFMIVMLSQIFFGALASIVVAYFSRRREFRADEGSAQLKGAKPMINALQRLGGLEPGELPKSMAASGITGKQIMSLFASHPPIEERIAALSRFNPGIRS